MGGPWTRALAAAALLLSAATALAQESTQYLLRTVKRGGALATDSCTLTCSAVTGAPGWPAQPDSKSRGRIQGALRRCIGAS